MNREDIIRMADEAGITPWEKLEYIGDKKFSSTDEGLDGDLTCLIQFATLVAAAECEACAKVASGYDASPWKHDPPAGHVADMVCTSIAAAIRARGQA